MPRKKKCSENIMTFVERSDLGIKLTNGTPEEKQTVLQKCKNRIISVLGAILRPSKMGLDKRTTL